MRDFLVVLWSKMRNCREIMQVCFKWLPSSLTSQVASKWCCRVASRFGQQYLGAKKPLHRWKADIERRGKKVNIDFTFLSMNEFLTVLVFYYPISPYPFYIPLKWMPRSWALCFCLACSRHFFAAIRHSSIQDSNAHAHPFTHWYRMFYGSSLQFRKETLLCTYIIARCSAPLSPFSRPMSEASCYSSQTLAILSRLVRGGLLGYGVLATSQVQQSIVKPETPEPTNTRGILSIEHLKTTTSSTIRKAKLIKSWWCQLD